MRTYIKFIIPLGITLFFLTSCIQPQEVAESEIVTARGIDLADDEEIDVSVSLLGFSFDKINNKTLTGKANTVKAAIKRSNYQTNYEIVIGKTLLDIYGRDIAEKGLTPYLDTTSRDANEPDQMYVAISNTTAKETLNYQEKNKEVVNINIGQYLHNIIKKTSRSDVFPKVTLQKVLTTMKDSGRELLLPVFDTVDGIPMLTSMAIFKEDKYVGDLSIEDKVLYNFTEGKARAEWFEVNIPLQPFNKSIKGATSNSETIHTTFEVNKANSSINLSDKKDLTFQTDISITIDLIEISQSINLEKPSVVKTLEKEVEKEIKKRYEAMFDITQELNADVFGYGAIYRMHKKDGILSKEEWDEKFSNIKVSFNINADIVHHGENY